MYIEMDLSVVCSSCCSMYMMYMYMYIQHVVRSTMWRLGVTIDP